MKGGRVVDDGTRDEGTRKAIEREGGRKGRREGGREGEKKGGREKQRGGGKDHGSRASADVSELWFWSAAFEAFEVMWKGSAGAADIRRVTLSRCSCDIRYTTIISISLTCKS